jgi:hydroxymethylbilane synthase
MKDRLVIGSRGSKLALRQADWVKQRLAFSHPNLTISVQIIKTSGDILKDAPLAAIGGKGVFTKELEDALREGRIDLAVHSLKDLPTTMPAGLTISTITEREDPRDALVVRPGLELNHGSISDLPTGCVVGTSSPRRSSQLKHLRPDIVIKELRGNVDSRLRKLDSGEYDAVILAAAGLRRLGMADRISATIDIAEMVPAVGQGALAIETRAEELETSGLLGALEDAETRAACTAERAFLRALGGGCELPIAAHGVVKGESLVLYGLVADEAGERIERNSIEGHVNDAARLGESLAEQLLASGASAILAMSHRDTST